MFKKKLLKAQHLWRITIKEEESSNLPSNEEIESQLKEIFRTVLISEERKTQIYSLNNHAKWKLISSYKAFIDSNQGSLKYIHFKEISELLDKLNKQPTIIDLHEIRNWFLRVGEGDVNVFCVYDGVKLLFKRLEEAELVSRTTKNFRKQMEILKLIEIIVKMPTGSQEILKIKNSFDLLFRNLHWVNIDMTSLALEIITHILWNSNEGQEFLLESLNKYKLEKKLKNRFDVILFMLTQTKNVLMIENLLCFINSMISSCTNEDKRLILKSELLSSGINNVFEKIKLRIAQKFYEVKDCLFEAVQQKLIDIKYSEEENNFYFTNENENVPMTADLKDLYVEDKTGKLTLDIHRLHSYICKNIVHTNEAHQIKENILNDKEGEEEENTNLYEESNYLKEKDQSLFEDHVIGILNQIEVFQKLVSAEKNQQKKLLKLEGFLKAERDFANIYDLIDQIKENVFQRENYEHFLLILQYLIMIPNSEDGDEQWESVEEILEKLISKKENITSDMFKTSKNEKKSSESLQKKITEYEELLKAKDQENKQHLHDKNELNLQLLNLRSSKTQENLIISQKLTCSQKQEPLIIPPAPPLIIPPPPMGLIGTPPINLINIPPPPPPPPPPPMGLPGIPGIGGPPPLLLSKPQIQKSKKKPKVPMRGPKWDGISKFDDIKGSVFEKIDDEKVKLDIEALEEDFKEKLVEKTESPKKILKKPEKISIIDSKRSKMFDILLAKLKLSPTTIAMSLYYCDEKILTSDNLELLIPVIPTEEEIKTCRDFKGDKTLLADPEILISEVGMVKGFANRIKALHFRKFSNDLLKDLKEKITILDKTWKSILKDERIPLLFQYILAHGNYLNGVTNRGGMYGFIFDGLESAVNCRSTKNTKRNLLIFVMEYLEKTVGKNFIEENLSLIELDVSSKIPINQLEMDLTEIKKGIKFMDLALNSYTNDPLDKIKEVLQEVYETVANEANQLEKKIKEIFEEYKKVAKFLNEDSKETSDKTAKKLIFMWQHCLNWKKEVEKKHRDEERKKDLAEKKKKALDLKIELKNPPIKRATDNLLKEKNLNGMNGKANPEDMIKELHEKRKNKKSKIGMTMKTTMVARMMLKNLKKKTGLKVNQNNKEEEIKKMEKLEDTMLKELIQSQLII